jgi:negative regulator of flagellin synthesis FlgM
MKVNNNKVNSAQTAAVRSKDLGKDVKGTGKNGTSGAAGLFDSSQVKMSADAQAMQKAKAIAGKDTVDEAKVARLQSLIDSGKYSVDAAAIADRMVDEHLATGE